MITHPGAPARRGETETIRGALEPYRQIAAIEPPGTMDGGDVLIVDRHVFIGISERTNREGAEQLGRILSHSAYTWTPIPVGAGLHLKSSVSYVGKNTLLLTQPFAQLEAFERFEKLVVDDADAYSANTLWINDTLIVPSGHPRTCEALESLRQPIVELDVSEARKMDGGLTCMSLRF